MNISKQARTMFPDDPDRALAYKKLRQRERKEGKWDPKKRKFVTENFLTDLGAFAARNKVLSVLTLGAIIHQGADILSDGEYNTIEDVQYIAENPGESIVDLKDTVLDSVIYVLDKAGPILEDLKSSDSSVAQK